MVSSVPSHTAFTGANAMKVTTLPYKRPRKPRKQEVLHFCVRWVQADTVYFQWFKRDSAACEFQQQLVEKGFQPHLLMK